MEARHNKSKQRQAIFDLLCASREHPSAEMIFSALKPDYPSLSLGTVYRNLSFFQQQGLAVSVANVDGNMRYDACTVPHPHLLCRNCRKVTDLVLPDTVSSLYDEAERPWGCKVESYSLTFTGLCPRCREEDPSFP